MNSFNPQAIGDSATEAAEHLQRMAESAVNDGKEKAGVLLDQSGDLIDSVKDQAAGTAADIGNRVVGFTKNNPVIALLIAVGAGALLIAAAARFRPKA